MKTIQTLLFLCCILGYSQVPNGNFNSGTTGWTISPANFSISAPSGYLQVTLSSPFSVPFYLDSPAFSVSSGAFELKYSFNHTRFDPMMGDMPMGGPAIYLKDNLGNVIIDFTTGSGLCINDQQFYGTAPVNTCTTSTFNIPTAGNYHLEFTTMGNPNNWFALDNISFINGSVLGTTNSKHDHFSVFPNPASDFIYIKNLKEIKSVKIFDSTGRLVKTTFKNSGSIDISDLQNGVYIIKVAADKKDFSSKFMIKK